MSSEIANILERRAWLKYFRDEMAQHPKRDMLGAGIVALNTEIDAQTEAIGAAISEGRATVKELFLLLDYPTFRVDQPRSAPTAVGVGCQS